ncbi:MAG: BolA/IbaG family iron-sulfur metabolism protein [Gammaproteobacteria bacterium]|nr:BolA/IbaG family iron-sulfur metabolism protein [Gammaproteobacteria bacterium]
MQPEEIRRLIEAGLAGCRAEVTGADGTHFEAVIISEQFGGRSMVQRHQMVYRALGERMGREIHALSIQTLTPDEWKKASDMRVI